MQLTTSEEEIMKYLWKLEKAFMKDIVDAFPEPKPAYTTIATVLKRMSDKGIVGYKQYGKVREYYPKIKKKDYFSNQINSMVKNFFNDSTTQFASFFTNESNLNVSELEELKAMIDEQIKAQKND
ncbi:MAG: BlaI/MecI/CopY family transcriptional regulator [Chitinophagales bacterium]